jgi:regulator of replication initiation timing
MPKVSYKKQADQLLKRQGALEADVTYWQTEARVAQVAVKDLEERLALLINHNNSLALEVKTLEGRIPLSTLETENENLRRVNRALRSDDRNRNRTGWWRRLYYWWRYLVVKP